MQEILTAVWLEGLYQQFLSERGTTLDRAACLFNARRAIRWVRRRRPSTSEGGSAWIQ